MAPHYAEDLFYAWGGKPVRKIIADLNEMHGLNMPVDALAARKESFYHAQLPELKGIPDVLEHMEGTYGQIPFAVVSGSRRASVVGSLTALGLLDKFAGAGLRRRLHARQARSRRLFVGASKLGVAPEHCLVFEDTNSASRRPPQPGCNRCWCARTSARELRNRKREQERKRRIEEATVAELSVPQTRESTCATSNSDHCDPLPVLCIAAAVASCTSSPTAATVFIATSCSFSPTHGISIGASSLTPLSRPSSSTSALPSSAFRSSVCGSSLFSRRHRSFVVSGLMARDLGGSRLAQVTTALAVALSPLPIFEATEFQYTSFEILWWVLIAWFTIRLLKTENPRWWLAIGAAVGLGLLTKYSIVFYIAGILAGMALRQRADFSHQTGSGAESPWPC